MINLASGATFYPIRVATTRRNSPPETLESLTHQARHQRLFTTRPVHMITGAGESLQFCRFPPNRACRWATAILCHRLDLGDGSHRTDTAWVCLTERDGLADRWRAVHGRGDTSKTGGIPSAAQAQRHHPSSSSPRPGIRVIGTSPQIGCGRQGA